MTRIFISYRREDSQIIAGRIYSDLSPIFGAHNIFFDRYAIPDGVDFREYLHKAVSECDVLLVVIGPKWVTIKQENDPTGERRIDKKNDFVRIEVQTGRPGLEPRMTEPESVVLPIKLSPNDSPNIQQTHTHFKP